jgi:hypothetical protein
MDAVAVSVAVMVSPLAVFRVIEKVPVPFVRVALAGSAAWGSLLLKCTVPVYVVTTLLEVSRAVTVNEKELPAVAVAGADTEN